MPIKRIEFKQKLEEIIYFCYKIGKHDSLANKTVMP